MTTIWVRYLLYKENEELRIRRNVTLDVEDGEFELNEHCSVRLGEACVALPTFENSHIHVLDSWLSDFFNRMYIDDVVGAPYGIKYFYLQIAADGILRESAHYAAAQLRRTGTTRAKIVVEYGIRNARIVEEATESSGIIAELFLEPSEFHVLPEESSSERILKELENIARAGKNIELISPLNYTREELELARELKRKYNVKIMTHVSETEDTYQDGDLKLAVDVLDADILVHCVHVRDEDVELLRGRTIVVTPRSNIRLVGKLPPLEKFLKYDDIEVKVGTDNVGLCDPNMWSEFKVLATIVSPSVLTKLVENNLVLEGSFQLVMVEDLSSLDKYSDNVQKFVRQLCSSFKNVIGIVKIGS